MVFVVKKKGSLRDKWRLVEVIWDLVYFFWSLQASVFYPSVGISLYALLLDWNNVCYSKRLNSKSMCGWLPLAVGLVKLNFDGCFLGNLGQLGIGGVIRNHLGTVVGAYS